jgi:hypothetical protein
MTNLDMIGRVVRTVEYNTGDGGPETIGAHNIRTHLCANATYPVEEVNRAIRDALERGDLVEREDGYVPADADTYRKYL